LRHACNDEHLLDLLSAGGVPVGRAGLGVVASLIRRADGLIGGVRRRFEAAERVVRDTLLDLTRRLETSKYLVGDEPTLADIAAVGLAFPLKFPASSAHFRPDIAGVTVPAIADDPRFARFFTWKDQFYRDFLR
jgi:glutathione S-transferase